MEPPGALSLERGRRMQVKARLEAALACSVQAERVWCSGNWRAEILPAEYSIQTVG